MKVFEFDDYKEFVRQKLRDGPKKAHGQLSRVAEHLGIHTSMVSQVFNGEKHLTFDQACGLCSYFGFTDMESDYFVALVQLERAGTEDSRRKCRREIARLKSQASSLNERLTSDVKLSEADNAIFYSHWFYVATKLLCSVPGYQTPEAIAAELGVPLVQVNRALEFLLAKGLCKDDDGRIRPGPANTHVGADSPMVGRHHQNWRVKGFEKMGVLKPEELFLTMPATLAAKDVPLLRQKIVEFIDEFGTALDDSKGEVMYCLNIDWFDVSKK